jgi:hypothetical protein
MFYQGLPGGSIVRVDLTINNLDQEKYAIITANGHVPIAMIASHIELTYNNGSTSRFVLNTDKSDRYVGSGTYGLVLKYKELVGHRYLAVKYTDTDELKAATKIAGEPCTRRVYK